jgi:hypothetical protein
MAIRAGHAAPVCTNLAWREAPNDEGKEFPVSHLNRSREMDVRPRPNRTAARRRWKILDANVVHMLALDGTVATLRKKAADDSFQLTIEARDRQATRKIAPGVARDPESPEFARIVAEMKAELLGPRVRRPAH